MEPINIGGIYADLDLSTGNLERGLARGRQAMDGVEREVRNLQAAFGRGEIQVADFNARLAELRTTSLELATRMRDAYSAIGVTGGGLDVLNRGLAQGGEASQRFIRGMSQVGYVLDDFQYSVLACVNNIQPLVAGFTGSMGLGAAAGVVAVSAAQLYKNWSLLTDALGVSGVRTEAEDMERLAKATSRTADEQERLNRFKREKKVIEETREGRPDAEKDQQKDVADAVRNADPEKVAKGLFETLRVSGRGAKLTPQELDDLGVDGAMPDAREPHEKNWDWFAGQISGIKPKRHTEKGQAEAKAKAEAKATEQDAERVNKLLARAQTDATGGALKELVTLVTMNPRAFPAGFAKDLEDNLPANRKRQEEWEQQGRANSDKFDRDAKKGKKADRDALEELKEDQATRKSGRKANLQAADLLMPTLDSVAGRAADDHADKRVSRDDALAALASKLEAAGMNPADARDAARDAFERAASSDRKDSRLKSGQAADRAGRKANSEVAEMLHPDIETDARRKAADVDRKRATPEEARADIARKLEDAGMSPEDAAQAAKDAFAGASGQGNATGRVAAAESAAMRKARDLLPNLDGVAEHAAAAERFGGPDAGEAIAARLKKEGLDGGEVEDVLGKVLGKARGRVTDRLTGLFQGADGPNQPSNSEVYGVSDLTKRIQSSVSDTPSEAKRQTALLEKLNDYMEKLANRAVVQVEVD